LSSAFQAAEAYTDAVSYSSWGLFLTSCPFLAEPQAQFRGDILDSRAALHGKGGSSGLVLQPAPERKTDQLPDAIPHQITYLQFQTGERLWIKECYIPSQARREKGGRIQQGLLEKETVQDNCLYTHIYEMLESPLHRPAGDCTCRSMQRGSWASHRLSIYTTSQLEWNLMPALTEHLFLFY